VNERITEKLRVRTLYLALPNHRNVGLTCDVSQAHHLSIHYYHAGMEADERARIQRDWSADKIKIIVATIAFGMGKFFRSCRITAVALKVTARAFQASTSPTCAS
jgi:superfamily II helicase